MRHQGLLLTVAAAALVSPVALRAQTSGGDSGDIIVTAQKREQSLKDVGLSITAVSSDILERRQILDPYDLTAILPSLSVANTANGTSPSLTLRGVGFNSSALGATPTVSAYVDQVALPYSAMNQGAFLDLERVEVYKGPQGTLYGQNATAGAINFIAAKPTDQLHVGVTGTYGRFNQTTLEGYVSGPISDTVRARLAVKHEGGDDWQKSYTRPRASIGARDRGAARLQVEFEFSPDFTARFALSGWYDKSDTQAVQLVKVTPSVPGEVRPEVLNFPVAPNDPRAAEWNENTGLVRSCQTFLPKICRGVAPSYDTTFYQPSLRLDWKGLDNITITSISAFSRYETSSYFDNDGTSNIVGESDYYGKIRSFSQEVRAAGNFDRLRVTVGGNFYKDKVTNDLGQDGFQASQTQNVVGFTIREAPVTIDQKTRSVAGFANAEFEVNDKLSVIGGVRYTDTKIDFRGCNRGAGYAGVISPITGRPQDIEGAFNALYQLFTGNVGVNPVGLGQCFTFKTTDGSFLPTDSPQTLKENNISWNATVNFKPVSNILLYALASKGYKSGSFPNFGATNNVQYAPVKQESLQAYEAGFKATLLDRALYVEGAAFYYDYKNKQLTGYLLDPVFGPLQALANIPKSEIKGLEGSVTVTPILGVSLGGSITYIDSKIKKFIGVDALGATRNFAGAKLNLSPKWSGSASARYQWAMGETLTASIAADLTFRSSTSGQIQAVGTSNPEFNIKSYQTIDLSASIGDHDAGWRVMVWGKNITNEYYWNNVTRTSDNVVKVAGMPATYGITLGWQF